MACSVQGRPKKARQVKRKVMSMLIICFDIEGTVHKELILAGQSVKPTHTTVKLYCDCVKMCEDFGPNFGDKRTGYCITTRHHLAFLFSPRNCLPNATRQPSCYPTFLFPRLKVKLKGSHFYTIEVMEAESQAVLNTLTEHDFQDAFKIW
jgi:hypothetical protein